MSSRQSQHSLGGDVALDLVGARVDGTRQCELVALFPGRVEIGVCSPHDGQDHPPVPADVPVFDVFTMLGFLAGQTSRLRLGTNVYNIV